jgi:hypothetical protein
MASLSAKPFQSQAPMPHLHFSAPPLAPLLSAAASWLQSKPQTFQETIK